MVAFPMKECRPLFLLSFVLASCNPAQLPSSGTPTETIFKPPSPTLGPYWGPEPSTVDPAGGWLPFRSDELSLAFEYPKAYEDGECGSPWITQKSVGDNEYHLIGLGSSIRISVFGRWASELDDVVRTRRLPPTLQLLSDVEGFTLGGESAFRYVFLVTQDPGAFEYAKSAWSLHRGKLYLFNYMDVEDLKRCDAPPMSEDAVYEHVLSSFEFLR